MALNFGPRPARRMFNERRTDMRDRAPKKALVRFGRNSSGDCTVLDVSLTGARLKFEVPAEVPPRFEIRIDGGGWKAAQVRWRARGEVGIEFG
jgi:hypothetical protein